jgi:hypothetical protein
MSLERMPRLDSDYRETEMAKCEIRTTSGKPVEIALASISALILALILADKGPTYNAGLALSWNHG